MQRLKELWNSDSSMRMIGAELGVSEACVHLWAKELSLPPRSLRKNELKLAGLRRAAGRPTVQDILARPDPRQPREPSHMAFMGPTESLYMQVEAMKRHVSVSDLERQLLATIAKDRMVMAVLDDASAGVTG